MPRANLFELTPHPCPEKAQYRPLAQDTRIFAPKGEVLLATPCFVRRLSSRESTVILRAQRPESTENTHYFIPNQPFGFKEDLGKSCDFARPGRFGPSRCRPIPASARYGTAICRSRPGRSVFLAGVGGRKHGQANAGLPICT